GASQLAVLYNGVLNSGLAQLSNNGLNIIPANTYALLNEVIANPGAYGFSNVTAPACGAGSSSVQCGPQGSGLPYSYAAGADQTYLFAGAVQNRVMRDQMLTTGKDGDVRTFVNIDYARQRFDASNNSPRTNSDNLNFTLGANYFAGEHVTAGVALGVGQHNADFSGGGGYKLQDVS